MRFIKTLALAVTSIALVFSPALAQQKIRVNLQGGPLPNALVWNGPAIAPSTSLLKCSPDQRAIVDPIIDATAQFVRIEGGSRQGAAFSNVAAIETPAHIVVSVLRAQKGSYAVHLDITHATLQMPDMVNAFYSCFSLRFGSASKAASLGLLVPTSNQSSPIYSPAVGFYVVM